MDERQKRIGRNEALFRELNERVKGVNEAFGVALSETEFVCECGDETCIEHIEMTVEEYEHVRSRAEWFAVKPGHEVGDVERVVERRKGYEIVEKPPGSPAEQAANEHPQG